jgi:hypothetical protein
MAFGMLSANDSLSFHANTCDCNRDRDARHQSATGFSTMARPFRLFGETAGEYIRSPRNALAHAGHDHSDGDQGADGDYPPWARCPDALLEINGEWR